MSHKEINCIVDNTVIKALKVSIDSNLPHVDNISESRIINRRKLLYHSTEQSIYFHKRVNDKKSQKKLEETSSHKFTFVHVDF